MKNKMAFLVAIAISGPLASFAEDRSALNQDQTVRAKMGEIKDETAFHKMIDSAATVYASVAKGPHGEVPASVLNNAKCIAIMPNVYTGALVVGGSHGSGVASCKNSNSVWSQPVPISLNQGSIGLQAGAKSADLVLYFQSNEAVKELKRGELTLGTDVSAVAGKYDTSLDASTAGIVAYTHSEGVFAGASVNGGNIRKDEKQLASYYGKKVDYVALLESRESPGATDYSHRLLKLLP